ncbi:sulfite exporter TauE/SafE family protein [Shimia thalassica]|uniref:sulfite exporter TauE/SafE family protein n=1 Tax=Shimia thalassica TaxID=1715693 RepID=UPI002736BEF3|nr:sulfite exporter TauE/SafE family protein [Shimia thalassica]MDP2494608.1 sulfite exporter TauE/SafE family protein [Shimia thalassica]
MDVFLADLSPQLFVVTLAIAILAGVIKGMVGFAMPMVMISGLSTFLPPELALAGLILPTLVTNGMQSLRQGVGAAIESIKTFRVFLIAGLVSLLISAQFVRVLPSEVMLLLIGVPVSLFALLQLMGLQISLPKRSLGVEAGVGGFAGLIGGLSGVWGPPTVLYLTALNTEKTEQMRVQGVIYGLGAVALFFAHIGSGVMRAETLPFSVAMVPPAVLGMWLGGKVQDRIDHAMFRKATLVVLTVAALNLVRRAVMG